LLIKDAYDKLQMFIGFTRKGEFFYFEGKRYFCSGNGQRWRFLFFQVSGPASSPVKGSVHRE